MPIVKCDYCGKEVERSHYKINRNKYFFCSKECQYNHRHLSAPFIKCEVCGKETRHPISRLKRIKHSFCSPRCHNDFRRLKGPRTYKTCPKCHSNKPASEYFKNRASDDGLSGYCKLCDAKNCKDYEHKNITKVRKRQAIYRGKNKMGVRKRNYKYLYGITVEQVEEMRKKQNGLCAICKVRLATNIDHDHLTGQFRGILCGTCNRGLGIFYDNPTILASAIEYLEKHGN